jgi:hypothetical protein
MGKLRATWQLFYGGRPASGGALARWQGTAAARSKIPVQEQHNLGSRPQSSSSPCRQAWPEAGRSPECRNIEAIEARGEAEQSGMERETRSEGWRSQIATVGTVRGTYRHLVFAEGFNLCSPIARQPGKSRIALRSREEASSGGVCPGQNRRWLLSPSLWDPAEALGGAQYFNIWLHAGASRACSSGPSPSPHRSGSRPVQY